MTMISHAQNFEDVILWRALGHIKNGYYVDIGAQDPVIDSISKSFYDAGWRGLHVEAVATYAAAMRAHRPNEIVIQAAVSDEAGPVSFFEISGTGLSTGRRDIADVHARSDRNFAHREIKIPAVSLGAVLSSIGERDIHWMKIDVEGMESSVLRSWGTCAVRPWVLLVESTFPNSQIATQSEWLDLVISRGYQEAWFDGLNRYFVLEGHDDLKSKFEIPPNVFDGFQVTQHHFTTQFLKRDHEAALARLKEQITVMKADEAKAAEIHQAMMEADHAHAAQLDLMAAKCENAEQLLAQRTADFEKQLALARANESKLTAAQTRLAEAEQALDQTYARLEMRQREHIALSRETGRLDGKLAAQTEAVAAQAAALNDMRGEIRRLGEERAALSNMLAEAKGQRDNLAVQLDAEKQLSHEQITAGKMEIGRLNDHIFRRERQLWDAAKLLAATPDPLGKLPRLRAAIARLMIGRSPAVAKTDHAAAVARWEAAAMLPEAQVPSPDGISSLDSNIAIVDAEATHGGFEMMESDGPITSVPKLLAPQDRGFIRAAYQAVLGRAPDAEGEAHYLARLRAGTHKLAILKQLRRSQEGRAFIPGVAGLDRAIKRHRMANLPLVGAAVRLFTGAEGNSITNRQLRMIMNDIGRLHADQEALACAVQQLAARGMTVAQAPPPPPPPPPSLAAAIQPPSLDSGPIPDTLDSSERRLLRNLRLFAVARGALA